MRIIMTTTEKKSEKKYVDKHKQKASSRQNDKLEQRVMLRAVEDDILRSNLGCKIQKGFSSFIGLYNKAQVILLVL